MQGCAAESFYSFDRDLENWQLLFVYMIKMFLQQNHISENEAKFREAVSVIYSVYCRY